MEQLPRNGLTFIASGATLAAYSGFDLTRISGEGTLTGQGIFSYDSSLDASLSTIINASATLAKAGAGTLTLTASNVYVGTEVSGGTLRISNGGSISNFSSSTIGTVSGSSVAVIVTGSGSAWNNNGWIYVGQNGAGSLLIEAGGKVNNNRALLGDSASGDGRVTVTGSDSFWTVRGSMVVGAAGTGSLTIADGAVVTADLEGVGSGLGTILLGESGAASGTLNIGAAVGEAAVAAGTLNAAAIFGGAGSGLKLVNFNYTGSINFNPLLTGALSVQKNGSGRTILSGSNTYTGTTTINEGILRTGSAFALSGSSEVTLADTAGAFLDLNGFNQSITALQGGGENGGHVMLSGATLTLGGDNTFSVFNGRILTGEIVKNGHAALFLGGIADNTSLSAVVNAGLLVLRKESSESVHAIDGSLTVKNGGLVVIEGSGDDQISSSSSVQVDAGGRINLQGRTEGFNSLTGAGDITNGSLIVGQANATSTFSGTLTDGFFATSLTKSGTGTLTLSGSNRYSGGTTVSSGTLVMGNASALGTGATTISAGATVNSAGYGFDLTRLSGSGTLTGSGTYSHASDSSASLAVILSGSAALTKSGTGTLTLTSSNAYSGATAVNQGTLILQNTTQSPTFAIAAGAVLDLSVASGSRNNAANTAFSGSGTLRKTGNGSVRWDSSSAIFAMAAGSLIDVQGGTFVAGSNGNEVWTNNFSNLNVGASGVFNGVEANVRVGAITGAGLIRSGFNGSNYESFTFGIGNGSGTLLADNDTGNGHLGSFVKTGTGTQILTGSNSFTGSLTINSGTLQIGNSGTSGSIATTKVINNGSLVFNRSDDITSASVISGSGALNKKGAEVLTLTGTNSYSGITTIEAGTLVLQNTTKSPTFFIATGAVLELNVASGFRDNAVGTVFSGSGTLRKTGNGSVHWEGSSAVFAMAVGSLIDIQGGGFWGGSYGNEVWTNNFSGLNVGASGAFNGVEANVRVDALTGAGLIRSGLNGSGYENFTFGVGNGSGTFSGVLADTGSGHVGNFVKSGTGTQILTGANTFTGSLTIAGGTLQIGHNGTTGSISTAADIVNNGALVFNRSDDMTHGVAIRGTGSFTKLGTGALTLTGSNSYTGGSTVSSGTLIMGNALLWARAPPSSPPEPR